MERKGIFPGTFDPVTFGHLEVLERALHLFDRVIVAVARSERQHKQTLFTVEERVMMLTSSIPEGLRNRVDVEILEGLLVDFARARDVRAVVRGLRFISDFEYEFQMAQMNQRLWGELDTVFLMPTEKHTYVNSTLVKEIARNGGSVRGLVPSDVARRLARRFRELESATRKGRGGR